jgi:hypothetical protein
MAAEQSVIELIYQQQNELNIDEFIEWLNSNYDGIVYQHKNEIMSAYDIGQEDGEQHGFLNGGALEFYKEQYGN